jgi:hypothetical protein
MLTLKLSILQQPELPLGILQTVLPSLDASFLQQPVLCCHWTRLGFRQPTVHAPGHVNQPVLPLYMPVPQQPMLPLHVSVQQQHLLPLDLLIPVLKQIVLSPEVSALQMHACASKARICSTAANAVPRGVLPTEACDPSVLSVCKCRAAPGHVYLHGLLCCTWTCLFTRALRCTWRVCLQELYAACTWT